MQVSTGSARRRAYACIVMVAASSMAGVFAGPDSSEAQTKQLSPAQVVALRFPTAWNNAPAMPAPSASARQQAAAMFDPNPTYGLASAESRPVTLPKSAMAYAEPAETRGIDPRAAAPAERKIVTAALPEQRPAAASAAHNIVLNDSQLASIKHRLALSKDQEQYWPQVEAALRAISRRIARSQVVNGKPVEGGRPPNIDPNSAEVQQLKNAAIPLLMIMREDQKREVRALARLIGLNQIASQI